MIDAKTVTYGVIGYPVRHSLSPVLQNWFIDLFGLNAVYAAFEVIPTEIENCMVGMKALGIGGLNVTLPHKERVAELADHRSPEVQKLGAANTLKLVDGRVQAFVTDPPGFLESLGENKKFFRNAAVTLLGAGGSARSILFALSLLSVAKVQIVNRTLNRAEALAEDAKNKFNLQRVGALRAGSEEAANRIASSDIIINTTSVGMSPNSDQSPVESPELFNCNQYVIDLIYNPPETALLRMARSKGATVQNGMDMLIFQGLESQRIWHKKRFELSVKQLEKIRKILYAELK